MLLSACARARAYPVRSAHGVMNLFQREKCMAHPLSCLRGSLGLIDGPAMQAREPPEEWRDFAGIRVGFAFDLRVDKQGGYLDGNSV